MKRDGAESFAEASDEALMAQFRQGNVAAFDSLYQRHRSAVKAYLARVAGMAAAEDLMQTAFVSLIRARDRFDLKARFKPWLYAIATNAARDFFRRRKPEELTPIAEGPRDAAESAAPAMRDEGLERAVHRALGQLPEGQRLAIVMHRFENLSFADIAQALDISETAAKVRAHRGYQRLRALLQGIWNSR